MQQECLAKTIMTSKRDCESDMRRMTRALVALVALLGGCASLPDDAPVVDQLDEQTGLTIARLGRPLELYVETPHADPGSRFGFLGPFATNQMGKREPFLWVALPVEPAANPPNATVTVNGAPLALADAGHAPDFAGLAKPPYKISTPWFATYYFRIDTATIQTLGQANEVAVQVTEDTRNGPVESRFSMKIGSDLRLRDFAAH
jgi:hypothetical protein